MATPFPFLRLPLELREAVYSEYFNPASHLVDGEWGGGQYRFEFSLYHVNKQIHSEAENVFRRENIFVRIETPWPTAGMDEPPMGMIRPSPSLARTLARTRRRRAIARVFLNHISQDGLVPIVAAGEQGKQFRRHYQLVEISAPIHQATPEHVIVVLLDDLHLFCQVWFYSALSYPALNHHLRTTFTLQDPYYPADPKPIPLALQKRLLLPFEAIKGLYETEVEGFDESVKSELERLMAKPVDTLQKCCEDGAEFMEQGDQMLAEGDATKAMDLYIQAFRSIHIIITGRTRRVLGDPFFHDSIESGRFSGQSGTTIRIILRIKLVSRVVAAYLKLSQWEEAAFWGMRSIRIMREAMESEFEDFLAEFVGAQDVGLLYLRTAIAMKKMEDYESLELVHYGEWNGDEGSEQLFGLVGKYMKGRMHSMAKKELNSNKMAVPESLAKVWEGEQKRESDKDSMRHLNQEEEGGGGVEMETWR